MRSIYLLLFTVTAMFLLHGCTEKNNDAQSNTNNSILHLSNENTPLTYPIPKKVQQIIEKKENHIKDYKAIMTKEDLFITIIVQSINQVNEQDIAKQIEKELIDAISNKEIHVTSDEKFLMEINKLQETNSISKKELEKTLTEWKKLLKDQT